MVEYDFDFLLVGITTSLKGYKLAWELNRQLALQLEKKEDIYVKFKGNVERNFANHTYETPTRLIKLMRNKPVDLDTGKHYLAPEYPHFDYLLMVRETERPVNENLIETIRKIVSVELAAFIPLETLKAKENFIF